MLTLPEVLRWRLMSRCSETTQDSPLVWGVLPEEFDMISSIAEMRLSHLTAGIGEVCKRVAKTFNSKQDVRLANPTSRIIGR